MSGYLALGIGFGMVLASRGYGVLWALAMSVFIFAGSMQYVTIDLITGGAAAYLETKYAVQHRWRNGVLHDIDPFCVLEDARDRAVR